MAAVAPDERFQRLREENERRRKKKEEEDKRRKQEEEQKAKEALERRRMERLEHDERMRKPWQQPPAPKKAILRKGAKQNQPSGPAVDPVRQSLADEKRREQRQGLHAFIKQQRQAAVAAKAPTKPDDGPPVVPLTWEELRVAAAAGFDELLRQQDLEAEQRALEDPPSRAARHRTPSRSPFRGPPAPAQETVQIALVPSHNPAAVLPAEPVRGSGSATPSALGPTEADRAAALRNSYKFSDAPVSPCGAAASFQNWPQRESAGWDGADRLGGALPGQEASVPPRHNGEAAIGGGAGYDAAPAAVLYPPPGWEEPGKSAFAGSGGDPTGSTHAASSVASSGGLRRGVTAATRYRAAPVDAASLDLRTAAPGEGWAQGEGPGRPSPRSSGQRPPLPGPYDNPSPQQWTAPGDPLEASLLAGGTLAALQGASGLRLASPRSSEGHPQSHAQPANDTQPHPAQRQPEPAAKAEARPARRGWVLPPQAMASQQEPSPVYATVQTSAEGLSHVPEWAQSTGLGRTNAATSALEPTEAQAVGQSYGTMPLHEGQPTPMPEGPAPLRHSIGVGDSGGPAMWQRDSAMVAPGSIGSSALDDAASIQYSQTGGADADPHRVDASSMRTPSRPMPTGPVGASEDLVRFSSPPSVADVCCQGGALQAAMPELPAGMPAAANKSYEQQQAADDQASLHQPQSHSTSSGQGFKQDALQGGAMGLTSAQGCMRRPSTADGAPVMESQVQPSGDPADSQCAARPAAPIAPADGQRISLGTAPASGSGVNARSSMEAPQPQQQREATAEKSQPPQQEPWQQAPPPQQEPLLPPIAPPRPSSGSARLPPLANGHQSAAPSTSLPQLHGQSQVPPQGTAGAMQPVQSVELPPAPQPQPPPMRAPSPPASPPRIITPQRFHRQLSASAMTPATAGAGTSSPHVGSTPPRPLSADLLPVPATVMPRCPPPPSLAVAAASEPVQPPGAAALPVSPRKPGVVAVTLASPSRHAVPPPQPVAPQQPSPGVHPSAASAGKCSQQPITTPSNLAVMPADTAASADCTGRPLSASRQMSAVNPGIALVGPQRPASASSPAGPPTATRAAPGHHVLHEPPVVTEEPSEQGLKADASEVEGKAYGDAEGQEMERPGSSFQGRPPSTAEGSVMSGSHISARPGTGSASLSGYGTRPSTGQGWGSGYQASMLDDSVSSFDFRLRSAAASRPTSATCAPPVPPHQLMMPHARSDDGTPTKGRTEKAQAAVLGHAQLQAVQEDAAASLEPLHGLARSRLTAAEQQPTASGGLPAHPVHRSSAAAASNTLHVLQPPAGPSQQYGVAGGYGTVGDGQPFAEEPVEEAGEEEHPQQPGAGRLTQHCPTSQPTPPAHAGAPDAVPLHEAPAAASGGTASPDMDDLMREIQALSALRKALKAEFESMGRGEAVAAMGTLSANFAPRHSEEAADAVGVQPSDQQQLTAPSPPPEQHLGAVPQPAVTPAPLLQWSVPGAALTGAPAVSTVPSLMELPPQPTPQGLQWMQGLPAAVPAGVVLQQQLLGMQAQAPLLGVVPPEAGASVLSSVGSASAAALLGANAQPFPTPALSQPPVVAPAAWGQGPTGSGPAAVTGDARGQSFAFASPGGAAVASITDAVGGFAPVQGAMPAPLPVAPAVMQVPQAEAQPPAAAQSPPPLAALQWTIPANAPGGGDRSSANGPVPQRAQRPSGSVGGISPQGSVAKVTGPTSTSGCSTPTRATSNQKRVVSNGGYAVNAVDSPVGGGPRSGGGNLAGASSSRGAASAAPAPERPLIHEGSYVQAALQARERAERERAAREALQAESAAAKAAALNRSKSDKAAMGSAAGAASPAGPAAGKAPGPLGPKAPSSIGSYVQPPAASQARPPARSASTGRGSVATDGVASEAPSATGTPAGARSGWSTPDAPAASAAGKQAWSTPTSSRPSRIPTPPRALQQGATVADASGAAGKAPQAAAAAAGRSTAGPPARQDSYDSDLDFLERASDVSDTETDSPSAYGITDKASPPPPRRGAFGASGAEATTAPNSANRERLEGGRPRPLHIPSSGAATPMGASTTSTVASHAVPTGGKGPNAVAGRSNAGKPSTPFTAAIRELMGLPGSAPLEQARPRAPGAAAVPPPGSRADAGPWPEKLSAEEEQLLASLQRLDANILRKGLMAAGIINEPSAAAPPSSGAPTKVAANSKGRGAGGPGAKGAGTAKAGAPLTNSLQQDQLRESLEKLDVRLGALRRKMEDRACVLGMPAVAAAEPAAAPGAASTPARNQRDATPPKDERRGPPATLAKSRTPTPNKAKAIRDQRQQQLSNGQGASPSPSRAAPLAGPPKPASAPVVGTQLSDESPLQQHLVTLAARGVINGSNGAAAMSKAGQPQGMPPRAPAAKAPASAPSGPSAVGNAAEQQQQQVYGAATPYGMFPGPSPALPTPYGAMQMYGMPPMQMAPGMPNEQLLHPQAGQQQQQVAYVAAVLPNGQVAYVPQYVGPGAAGAFPGFMQAMPQQPFMLGPGPHGQQQQGGLMPPGLVAPGALQHPQQQGGPMMAWAASPQAAIAQPPHGNQVRGSNNGVPSLYSFDRSGPAYGVSGAPHNAAAPDTPTGSHAGGYAPVAQQQPPSPTCLPYTTSPPPTGPMPHYHSSVMRTRSFGSRDGEAASTMAAGMANAALLHHQQGQHGLDHQSHHGQAPQRSAHTYQPAQEHAMSQHYGNGAAQAVPQQAAMSAQPHAVQFQTFGPKGSSRGVGATAGWSPGNGGGGAEASTANGGVIKAVNLGLLLS